MSGPENLNGAVADPFQARFGVAAGTQAPEVERQRWEQLCRELLLESRRVFTPVGPRSPMHRRSVL